MMKRSIATQFLVLFGLCTLAHGLEPIPLCTVPEAILSAEAPSRPAWERAAFLGPFVSVDGRSLPAAATTARICRTFRALWLRVECTEPRMDKVKAIVTAHDGDVWKDDCVEVFLQRPGETYLHFVVNPAGTQFDERGRDASWNVTWQAAAEYGKDRWSVELELPWTVLGGTPRDGETWRLNIARSRTPVSELCAWSPTGSGFHVPDCFGEIVFSQVPYPLNVRWQFPDRRTGRVDIKWEPAAPDLRLEVNGTALSDGEFRIDAEGTVPLTLTAKRGETPVFRTSSVVAIPPIRQALSAVRDRIETVPKGVSAEIDAECKALLDELAGLEKLDAIAPPDAAAEVVRQAEPLALRSSQLALRATMLKAGAKPDGIFYGIERSLTKLLRHQPFTGTPGGTLRLDAARREMDAGQVVLFADTVPLLAVQAEMSPATGPDGASLPASAFRIRRVGYIPTIKPVYRVEHVGLWPDPLLAGDAFDVRENSFESLWLDVRVPEDAVPGEYSATLTLIAANKRPTLVPVRIRVRNFTIPLRPSLCSAFGVTPGYRIKQDTDAYIRNALEHRISPYSVAGSPTLVSPPALDWSGAQRIELDLTSDRPGSLAFSVTPADGTPMRQFAPVSLVAGRNPKISFDLEDIAGTIRTWYIRTTGPLNATLTATLVRANGSTTLVEAESRQIAFAEDGWLESWPAWSGSGWDKPDIPAEWNWEEYDARMTRYLPLGLTTHRAGLSRPFAGWAREYERHLREKGWLDLAYTYLYDEPRTEDYPKVNAFLGEVKRGSPGLKNMMTARHFPPELKYVDIWCPEAYSFDPEAARAEQEKGKTVWWYVAFSTRHPYPNVWVDYPALDCRVWPWMTWKHDLDGMLYWSVTAWGRNDPWCTGETFPNSNGDGSMLYPGRDGQPVDSIRWECLRDGMEDYEVFCLLEAGVKELRAAGGDVALVKTSERLCAIDDDVVRSYKDYNPDPDALLGARERMSDALEKIVQALGHEPVITGRPRYRPPVTPPPPPPVAESATGVDAPPAVDWKLPVPQPEPGLVLRYAFDDKLPFACDLSGSQVHGTIRHAQHVSGNAGGGLRLDGKGSVALPGGLELLGTRPGAGTIAVWARPGFRSEDLSTGTWEGYKVIFYVMESDGNGLPDGNDEIGLFVHGTRLQARCGGNGPAFAAIPSPLRPGQWTHVCLTWTKTCRTLYVDGKKAAEKTGEYPPPNLDTFPGRLGTHPPHERWGWEGDLDEFRVYRRALAPNEVEALAKPPFASLGK